MSEPKTPSFCRISGDLAPSTRKSLAIAIVRFWCAKVLKLSLVAFGNRFQVPRSGVLPKWVMPAEQDGLFWVKKHEGIKLLLQACGAWTVYLLALSWCAGLQKGLHLLSQWCVSIGPLQQASRALAGCMLWQTMVACCLLMSVADCRIYICPRTLEWASACLSATPCTHILVLIAWLHLHWQASQPWWVTRVTSQAGDSGSICGWILMVSLVVAMSPGACVVVAAQSVPRFLDLGSYWLKVVSASVGFCQGLASSIVTPRVARKAGPRQKHMYVSAAVICTTFLLPGLVALYFSESCLGRWMSWWDICSTAKQDRLSLKMTFRDLGMATLDGSQDLLQPRDVCHHVPSKSLSACARSMISKLQAIFLGKLVTMIFLLPAWKLCRGSQHKTSKHGALKLALLLELAIMLAPTLPLSAPLFVMGVLIEEYQLAFSFSAMKHGRDDGVALRFVKRICWANDIAKYNVLCSNYISYIVLPGGSHGRKIDSELRRIFLFRWPSKKLFS